MGFSTGEAQIASCARRAGRHILALYRRAPSRQNRAYEFHSLSLSSRR